MDRAQGGRVPVDGSPAGGFGPAAGGASGTSGPGASAPADGTGAGAGFTWIAGLRRYFAGTSYFWASVGRGARALETGAAEEILAGPAWLFEAGFDLTALRGGRLRGYVSRREGIGGADSTALGLVAGYRF